MKYNITLRIGEQSIIEVVPPEDMPLRTIYKSGVSLIRIGKRTNCKMRFVVRDMLTGKTLFWLYCRTSVSTGEFIARHARIGYYKPHEITEF